MSIVSNDIVAWATRGVFKASTTDVPDAPVLVSVTDDGAGSTVTAALTGTGTITLFYRVLGTAAWITGLTRSGDGNIQQTGLSSSTWYEFYATITIDGSESGPSAVLRQFVSSATETTIESALCALLKGSVNITGIVGTRIYPIYIPRGKSVPALTYQQISGVRSHTNSGADNMVPAVFQINCWTKTYAECRELANTVRNAVDDYSGTISSVVIQGIHLQDEDDIPELSGDNEKLRRQGKRLDFKIWFNE